ncbi:Transcription factor, fungi [Metarhizium guizhouense ARSEF 977]|uniref:Transcription factor, fungi n=1 Tax=Metarhizium guizhouense (strain ARSEF 977) TaxID=1276136 RepID=A0A0B4I0Q0_METGA|nr:Transcription factor, fungi [Metarhizium guizhouense ARSEF 977]
MEAEQPPRRSRRKFVTASTFGGPREWRSKKSRACDVCRRRKTACVIKTNPPCQYCRKMSLSCQSLTQLNNSPQSSPSQSSSVYSDVTPEGYRDASNTLISKWPSGTQVISQSAGGKPSLGGSGMESPCALEDNVGRNATYMSPAAEQDPELLASFRSSILSELDEEEAEIVQVHPGVLNPHCAPVHFNLVLEDFPAADDAARQFASDTIESKIAPYGPTLVRLFFQHVHPTWPVLMKGRFLRQYCRDKNQIPTSLRGAVYALASTFWKHEPSVNGPCPFQQHELETLCLDSLRRELIAPNLANLQGCLLLQHITPPSIDTIESSARLMLATQATTAAYRMGLHRDPDGWNIASWEKIARKKLWWATYVADALAAQAFGTPYHIQADVYSTSSIEIDDVLFDEDVPSHLQHLASEDTTSKLEPAARFVATVNLARISRQILHLSLKRDIPMPLAVEDMQRLLDGIKHELEYWHKILPGCLSSCAVSEDEIYRNNAPLHLAFHATQTMFLRVLMAPATTAAKANPHSPLRRWFKKALQSAESFVRFISKIGAEELDRFWGCYARSQLNICGNFLIYLFLLASEPEDVAAAYQLLEKFHVSLQKLNNMADMTSRLLIRPVALRIDSFFIHAPQIVRQHSIKS